MSVCLSPKLKIVLRVVYRARGTKNTTQAWIDFRKEWQLIKQARAVESYKLAHNLTLDGFDLQSVKQEALPSKKSFDRCLLILKSKRLVVLHKDGSIKQSHTFPVVTKQALPLVEDESFLDKWFGIEI